MSELQERERSIFLRAIEFDSPKEVSRFLDEACGADGSLRKQVETLLAANLDRGDLFDQPETGEQAADQTFSKLIGSSVGPYKLREQIGEGGFGVVYVAEQKEPVSRKVALKLIKPGMDSKDIIARFEAERQALAMMDHPNVAKVLDAGSTEDGRPYFVMELVKGVSITEACDEGRLNNQQRLELFVEVCNAVQHAHQKGIIHRDLKPSNVMVTTSGERLIPKVIDFGVAKALHQNLTDKSIYTAYGQLIGTPMYMSPEQAQLSSLDVDTRSDIYSLGVLLYELLTGTTPFDKETFKQAGFEEIRRIIREDEPLRPSDQVSTLHAEIQSTVSEKRKVDQRTLSRSLRGELDWIVMKTLEKDRNRRYETAKALSDDIQRFLIGDAVVACPPTALYRLKKLALRNMVAVAFTSLICMFLIAVIVGLIVSNSLLSEKESETQAALEEARNSQQETENANKRMATINDFVIKNIVQSANPISQTGSRDITVRDSILAANELIDETFQDDPMLRSHVKVTFGEYLFGIGEFAAARTSVENALSVYLKTFGRENPYTIDAMRILAKTYREQGELDLALSTAKEVVELSKMVHGKHDREAVRAIFQLAAVLVKRRQFALCEETANELITLAHEGEFWKLEGLGMQTLGINFFNQRQFDEAELHWLRALEVLEEGGSSSATAVRSNLAKACWELGKRDEAIAMWEQVLESWTKQFGPDHPMTLNALQELAVCKNYSRDSVDAIKDFRLLVERTQSRYGPEHEKTAKAMGELCEALVEVDPTEAVEILETVLEIEEAEFGKSHSRLVLTFERIARAYHHSGQHKIASQYFGQAIDTRLAIGKEQPENFRNLISLGGAYNNLGNMLRDNMFEYGDALNSYSNAITILEKICLDESTVKAERFLSINFMNRAKTNAMIEDWERAFADIHRAIDWAPSPDMKDAWLMKKAWISARQGNNVTAVEVVDDVLTRTEDDGDFYLAAAVMALCVKNVTPEPVADDHSFSADARRYKERSLQLLERAWEAGYFQTPKERDDFHDDHDFDTLRELDEFKITVKKIISDDESDNPD